MNIKSWKDVIVGIVIGVNADETVATVILLEQGVTVDIDLPEKYSDVCSPGTKWVVVCTDGKYVFADAVDNVRLIDE